MQSSLTLPIKPRENDYTRARQNNCEITVVPSAIGWLLHRLPCIQDTPVDPVSLLYLLKVVFPTANSALHIRADPILRVLFVHRVSVIARIWRSPELDAEHALSSLLSHCAFAHRFLIIVTRTREKPRIHIARSLLRGLIVSRGYIRDETVTDLPSSPITLTSATTFPDDLFPSTRTAGRLV